MCVLETTISSRLCVSCNNQLSPESQKIKWEYYEDLCKNCNEYIMTNSPFYQADYERGFSKWNKPLKGILMINNENNVKRILFFTKNHRKLTIPVESIQNMDEIFPESQYQELEENPEKLNKTISNRFAINFLDDDKKESPVFHVNEPKSALNAIYEVLSEYENIEEQTRPSTKLMEAIKNAHKESMDVSVSQDPELDIKKSEIEENPLIILNRRLAKGEISKSEYQELRQIIL